jgi:membrane-associated phospholipid phosphatase
VTEKGDEEIGATPTLLEGIARLASVRVGANGGRAPHWINTMLRAPDALPVALVLCIVIASFVWNLRVGLIWTPELPLLPLLAVPATFLAVIAIFSTVYSNRVIVELATYFGLWGVFPVFGVRLNYLAATLDFPLQDKLFARADAAFGFDWRTWASAAWSHPAFIKILNVAYQSNLFQPFFLIVAFALWGPRGRNRELLTATVFAALATVAIFAIFPAFGPNRVYGIPSGWDSVLEALRMRTHVPLHYVGIVTFPSFHASMAVLLAAATRDYRYVFVVSAVVNGLMLIATVPIGYHYLVDVFVGCAIALGSLYIAQLTGDRTIGPR